MKSGDRKLFNDEIISSMNLLLKFACLRNPLTMSQDVFESENFKRENFPMVKFFLGVRHFFKKLRSHAQVNIYVFYHLHKTNLKMLLLAAKSII